MNLVVVYYGNSQYGVFMGKFPAADAEITKVLVCRKCKGRNSVNNKKCRRCGYTFLRPKNKTVRRKK